MCKAKTINVLGQDLQIFINKRELQEMPLSDKKSIAEFIFLCAKISNQKNMNTKLYPHLAKLENEAKNEPYGTLKYWMLRCQYLEKYVDPTYSEKEQNNCRKLYKILANKGR